MNATDRLASAITTHSKLVIVVLLVASAAIGVGAAMVEQTSSLDAFQSDDSPAAHAQAYVDANFSTEANTTSVQLIVREENVLDKDSLRAQLDVQKALRANETVNATLATTTPTTGIANALATAGIFRERAGALAERGATLEARGANLTARGDALEARGETLVARGEAIAERRDELNATAVRIADAINATRAIQANYTRLNRSFASGNRTVENYSTTAAALESRHAAARERASANLSSGQVANVTTLLDRAWALEARLSSLNRSRAAAGLTDADYQNRTATIEAGFEEIDREADALLVPEYRAARERDNQLAQNRSRLDSTVARLRSALDETRALQRQYDALNRSFTDNTGADTYVSQAEGLQEQLGGVREDAIANLTANQTARFDAKLDRARGIQRQYDALNASLFAGSISQSGYDERAVALETAFDEVYFTVFAPEYRALREREEAVDRRRAGLNTTGATLDASLDRTRALQRRYDARNRSLAAGAITESTYAANVTAIEEGFTTAHDTAVANLTQNGTARYETLQDRTRTLQHRRNELDALAATEAINRSTYRERITRIGEQLRGLYDAVPSILVPDYVDLRERATALETNRSTLEANRSALQNASAAFEDRRETFEANRSALQNRTPLPTFAEQRAHLATMNATEVDAAITSVLGSNASTRSGPSAFSFMPTSYEPGRTDANATAIVVTQTNASATGPGAASDRIVDSQLAIEAIAEQRFESQDTRADGERTVSAFGSGIITEEIERSITDSLLIVGPLAVVFVLVVLVIAYRDLLDVLLGLVGIGLVLGWTLGFMGWVGIAFNQIFVVIPVLLIGLSIDYAIHVFMRHREERTRTRGVGRSMRVALGSVGVALVMVTATAVIGFLSNLISSVPPIREFGIVSAVGITSALVIFGGLIPALKVELDGVLESRGWDRKKRAVGTGGGRLGNLLSGGALAARKAPWIVLAIALVLTVAGGVAATQVDTSFAQADFLADDPPGWTQELPEPFAPGEYTAKDSLSYVNDQFVREDQRAEILVRGAITSPDALERVDRGVENASTAASAITLPTGEADVRSPLSVLARVATDNETVNATLAAADTDGDGVPDRNVEDVYDALYRAAPDQARSVIHRTEDGSYEALRTSVAVKGDAADADVAGDARGVAASIEGGGVSVVATGQPVVFDAVQDQLLRTVIESLAITLVATFVFLMVAYRLRHGSATLGFLTLLPVAFSVAWILGTMYLLSIPFNIVTGLITSLTVGLGIAYSIHLSERYRHELARQATAWEAMRTTVTGTGGALLGSAATTVGGFGVLAFAILPPLQQFGIITALTIVYAFLGSVLVLPSLLVLWTRYLGPRGAFGGSSRKGTTGRNTTTDDRSTSIED